MLEIQSKLTSQGQVSIPSAVRSALGVQPGSSIRWTIEGGKVSVRKEARYTNADLHAVLFPHGFEGAPKTDQEIKAGITQHMLEKYARR